jgi:hypothetical protein
VSPPLVDPVGYLWDLGLYQPDHKKPPQFFKENSSSANVSGSAKVPVITIQGRHFLGNFQAGGFRVKITQGSNQVTLYRMLVAGLVFDQGGLSLEGVIALFDLQGRLEQKLGSDPQFTEKYSSSLETVNLQLRKLRYQTFPVQPISSWKQETAKLLHGFLPGPNDYFGWSRNPKSRCAIRIIVPNPLKPPPKRPAKAVIGVGYKDSGNRRDPAKDGVSYKDLMKADGTRIGTKRETIVDSLRAAVEDKISKGPRGRG